MHGEQNIRIYFTGLYLSQFVHLLNKYVKIYIGNLIWGRRWTKDNTAISLWTSKYSKKDVSGRCQRLSRVLHITPADVTSKQLTIIDAKEKLSADALEMLNCTAMVNNQYLTLKSNLNCLYRCTVHFVIYFSNTPTNAYIYPLII